MPRRSRPDSTDGIQHGTSVVVMGNCGACDHEFADLPKFCPECGQSTSMQMIDLVDDSTAVGREASAPGTAGGDSREPAEGARKRRWLPALLGGLVIVVAAGALLRGNLFAASSIAETADDSAASPASPDVDGAAAESGSASEGPPGAARADSAATATTGSADGSIAGPIVHLAGAASPPAATEVVDGEMAAAQLQALLDADLPPETLVVVSAPDTITLLDLQTGERSSWEPPEPLTDEDPIAVDGSVVVVGETRAWVRPLELAAVENDEPDWKFLGLADRVRFSTKPDRVWLRQLNPKERPSDAEYLWNEVDLDGTVHRTMFRDREIYFPTPELVAGIGGDLFRLTDADINAWRLFSPYGVLIATGPNDLIVKECNTDGACERIWYDTGTGQPRESVFADLAQEVDASYGARLSLDGRFIYSAVADAATYLRSVATGTAIRNDCRWSAPMAWTTDSEAFACVADGVVQLYLTGDRSRLQAVELDATTDVARLVFVPAST